jgi:hypothetical protein
VTRVPAVVGIKRDTTSDIQIPSLTISVGKTVARVAGGWCPHPGSRSAADKLGLGTRQLYGARTAADYDRGRQPAAHRGGLSGKSNRARLHAFVLDFCPRGFPDGDFLLIQYRMADC